MIKSLANSSITNEKKYRSMMAGSVENNADHFIAEAVVSTAVPSVSFDVSSLAALGYKHLQIRATVRTNRADTDDLLVMRFNGDSGANYAWHRLGMTTSSGISSQGGGGFSAFFTRTTADTNTANSFGAIVIDILDSFSVVKNKTVRALDGQTGSYGAVTLNSGAWLNTAATNSLAFTANYGTNFVAGSRFSLYASKG